MKRRAAPEAFGERTLAGARVVRETGATIRVTRNTSASGKDLTAGRWYRVGVDLSEADARTLVRMGKAAPAAAEAPEKAAPPPETDLLDGASSREGK
jgi:hypothetical protein